MCIRDRPRNEFRNLFAKLDDDMKSSSGLSEEILKAWIANNYITKKDNKVDLVHKSTASKAIQGEVKGMVMSMNEDEMNIKAGELLLLDTDDLSELQRELLRQLLLKTEK